ncbi:MAG: PAS domain-containing protein, partial [Litorimonas sp.]
MKSAEATRQGRMSASRASGLIEAMPLSMVIADPHRPGLPIVYVNRAFEEVTGYSARFAVGRNCSFLQAG